MINLIFTIISLAILIYGGWNDYKKREIPNIVHIVLITCGFFTGGVWLEKVIGFFVPALIIYFVARVQKRQIGGGDFKLYASSGFNLGIYMMLPVYLISATTGLIWARIKKTNEVPLCTFVAIGYAIFTIVKIIFIIV